MLENPEVVKRLELNPIIDNVEAHFISDDWGKYFFIVLFTDSILSKSYQSTNLNVELMTKKLCYQFIENVSECVYFLQLASIIPLCLK